MDEGLPKVAFGPATLMAGLAGTGLSRLAMPSNLDRERELMEALRQLPADIRRRKAFKAFVGHEYADVPHTTMSAALGAPKPSMTKLYGLRMLGVPLAEMALGGLAGHALGPAGALTGAFLAGGLGPLVQRYHEHRLNKQLASQVTTTAAPKVATLLYNMALAAGIQKEAAVSPLLLAATARALTAFPEHRRVEDRVAEFHQRADALHPHDVQGARQLLSEYNTLPHRTYANALGVKPHGILRRIAPNLITGPALAMQGASMGSALGPAGSVAGALLGGVGSHILNRAHNRGLNKSVGSQL